MAAEEETKPPASDKDLSKQSTVRSLQSHLSHVSRKSKAIDKFMLDRKDRQAVIDHDIDTVKELIVEFKATFKRMEDKWEALALI